MTSVLVRVSREMIIVLKKKKNAQETEKNNFCHCGSNSIGV